MKLRILLAIFVSLAVGLFAIHLWDRLPGERTMRVQTVEGVQDQARSHFVQSRPAQAPAKQRVRTGKPNPAETPKVLHDPTSPRTGQAVRITADFNGRPTPDAVLLEYQAVDPGKYIALDEPAFEKQWRSAPMNDRGESGDESAQDRIFTADLPGDLQQHRRLIRYRLRLGPGGAVIAPHPFDTQPNFAYFTYDGVPPWKGAVHPGGRDGKLRQPVTFSSEALQQVPVYHFISSKPAIETVTWHAHAQFRGNRQEYLFTGTMVYDGKVYDHIGFRARGGSWRHAMGKNMWKFNFLPGHRFEARDHYGQRYGAKWDKLNLGACIQQGDYGMRGEQGMFEAVGFRLFNLAGIEASRTHWVHLRIIDQAEESPASQYAGDFWGLYLAVENVDEHFLKEHALPAGNLYKMEFGAKTAFNGNPAIAKQEDVMGFAQALRQGQPPDAWWMQHVDLSRYYNYRSILEYIHHYDIDAGKNYFYYLNPESGKWVVIPWDIDLSWGDQMFGGGHEPFYRAGLLSRPPFKQQYQERLAEIRDLLFNPDEIGRLIDEHAAMIADPKGGPSLADADRAKWDYHPILASSQVLAMKAGQGKFYFGKPQNTFPVMVHYMKGYAARRASWIDSRLLRDYQPPPAPKILAEPLDFSRPTLTFRLDPRNLPKTVKWRLAEITQPDSPAFDPARPWKYEIEPLWEQQITGTHTAELPANLLAPGRFYRVRARGQDASGRWTRWSDPIQFMVRR